MPTYEYRCPKGHEFELFQRMSDEPKANCPECGEAAARLLSSGAGFLFKGEGFYITDYRSEDYRKAAKTEEKAGSEKGATKDSSSTEVKGTDKSVPSKEASSPPPDKKASTPVKKPGGSASASS